MNEKIKIIKPSLEISELQKEIIIELSKILPDSSSELIGSMAVPISGKSEIDVMVVSNDVNADSKLLVEKSYIQGPVVKEISHLNTKRNGIRVDLQILPVGHKMIGIHRRTLEKLRADAGLSQRYEDFKNSLDGLPEDEYRKKKNEWIKNNIQGKK
ncbi:hypothetical protein A2738_00750 [Candidatus Nomurabacteria bacterium RIFCSPHIGHO2_01_FULL_42_15]|uniref:Polymerase nucleotidyl transferase domain-containing protein n=1 Tax=Candidatus Nomurabacteria bacterium RIFCSPHIGHO2_01_FULL_42_15 TaxID=1801742 RepID=A0A1F6VFH5_9BACT|nr:MAG: hypothetical protein A2738_00750 [Candidatus Nomurabacteria bacterium RIFCSPHIGHO2_01_FULL_42_15]OGI93173.1 MAG: hypothetical protein A3A99_01420 [Candidatus Nomurabacteria bacterium RIFCSPLOWO2_01_FULL_41_18]